LSYYWVYDQRIAQGPIPSLNEINELAEYFDAFIVLIEPHEYPDDIDKYISKLKENNIEVLYVPTPDFHPIELFELHKIALFIDKTLHRGKKVFIHCYGGIGRSSLASLSYMIYSGLKFYDAINRIRRVVPGALDNYGQWIMGENYYYLLKIIDQKLFNELFDKLLRLEHKKYLHYSKTTQLIVELYKALYIDIDWEKLVIANINHHKDIDFNEIIRDPLINDIINDWMMAENLYTLIIRLVHILDSKMDQRVIVSDHDKIGDKLYWTLYCRIPCTQYVNEVNNVINKLNRFLDKQIYINTQLYTP